MPRCSFCLRSLSPAPCCGHGAVQPGSAVCRTIWRRAGATETVRVPTGSALLAQVHGGGSVPRLAIDRETREFEAVDKHIFRSQTTLSAGKTPGKTLSVTQGGTTPGHWSITIIPDNPPEIA